MSEFPAKFLSREEFRALHDMRRRLLAGVLSLYAGLVLVFLLLFLARVRLPVSGSVAVAVAAFPVIGWLQFSLVQALHEVAHRVMGTRNVWGRLAAALMLYPLGLTHQFRTSHLAHHRYFGDPEKDPDYAGFATFPASKWALALRLLYYASGVAALRDVQTKLLDSGGDAAAEPGRHAELVKLVLAQGLMCGILSLLYSPWYYVGLWVAPLFTVVRLWTGVRLMCEHASPHGPFVWRSFTGSITQRNFVGSFGLCYHGEHHLYPTVPFETLATLQMMHIAARAAEDAGAGPPEDVAYEQYAGGHLGLLAEWFQALPLRAPASAPTA